LTMLSARAGTPPPGRFALVSLVMFASCIAPAFLAVPPNRFAARAAERVAGHGRPDRSSVFVAAPTDFLSAMALGERRPTGRLAPPLPCRRKGRCPPGLVGAEKGRARPAAACGR
jgi:hypothetical protein